MSQVAPSRAWAAGPDYGGSVHLPGLEEAERRAPIESGEQLARRLVQEERLHPSAPPRSADQLQLAPVAAAGSGFLAGDLASRPPDRPWAGYNPAARSGPPGQAIADDEVPSCNHPQRCEEFLCDASEPLRARVAAWIRFWRPDQRAARALLGALPEVQRAALKRPGGWASARSISASFATSFHRAEDVWNRRFEMNDRRE
eukprot:9861635-Alexandrium_andersonii.AAC.1